MKLAYLLWNYLIPNFIKNLLKLLILRNKYKHIYLSKWAIDKLSIISITNGDITFDHNTSIYESHIRWQFKMWQYSYINWPNTNIVALGNYRIEIWKYCCVAMNVNMITYNDHLSNKLTNYPFAEYSEYHTGWDIIIWNDVWIWMNSIILPWVKIWNWAVIWAWTVVTKDVPDYAIFAWNPWKVIRFRFEDNVINELQQSEWWNWSIEKVKQNYNLYFLTSKIDDSL